MSPSPLAGEGKLSRSDSRERGRRISKLRGRAKDMRSHLTDAEHRLWQILRAHRFAGYKFRRQVPIEFYIADFVCFARRLIVELDGGQHSENARDEKRDAYLESQGFRVLRIWNNDLFENEEGVAELILSALRSPPLPNPSPARGEGLVGDTNA
jgi:very-short-patch-repair endonuclease